MVLPARTLAKQLTTQCIAGSDRGENGKPCRNRL
jgi:hypothetical protein